MLWLRSLELKAASSNSISLKLIFQRSEEESQCNVSVTGNDETFSYGFSQTDNGKREKNILKTNCQISQVSWLSRRVLQGLSKHFTTSIGRYTFILSHSRKPMHEKPRGSFQVNSLMQYKTHSGIKCR